MKMQFITPHYFDRSTPVRRSLCSERSFSIKAYLIRKQHLSAQPLLVCQTHLN
ncbi:MAG: hypothetical protein LBR17_04160 [Bacteroidales bacterium]|nr:hypothetical protein [Bacteroidales bacterium]